MAEPNAETAAVIILAFEEAREWLKDSRKRAVLVKAWSIVRGTEYEDLVKGSPSEKWIVEWSDEQDKLDAVYDMWSEEDLIRAEIERGLKRHRVK